MVWDFGALGPAKEVFERVDHRHLDDLLPGLPAPCEDTAQLLADYLGDQLARTDLPFAHLVGDVAVVDAWPDAGSRAWGSVAPGRCGSTPLIAWTACPMATSAAANTVTGTRSASRSTRRRPARPAPRCSPPRPSSATNCTNDR